MILSGREFKIQALMTGKKAAVLIALLFGAVQVRGENLPPPKALEEEGKKTVEAPVKRELDVTEKAIFTDRKLYEILDVKITDYLFTVNRLSGLNVALYPKLLFIRNSLPIDVHSEFLSKVVFDGWKVVKVLSSSGDFKELTYTDNVLFLQPKKSLTVCNVQVFLQDLKTGRRQIVELLITQFDPYLKRDKGRVFYTTYLLIPPKPLPPHKVLDFYYAVNRSYPSLPTTVDVAGVSYGIIPNPEPPTYPNVSAGGKDFYVYPLSK